jgi:hypothetical protein
VTVYADTSWWLAFKSRRDANHEVAITLFDKYREAKVVWTPWPRVEFDWRDAVRTASELSADFFLFLFRFLLIFLSFPSAGGRL